MGEHEERIRVWYRRAPNSDGEKTRAAEAAAAYAEDCIAG